MQSSCNGIVVHDADFLSKSGAMGARLKDRKVESAQTQGRTLQKY